jgi:multidrug efflux system membrane fusion protein
MTRRRRIVLVGAVLLAVFAAYEAVTSVVAYTGDAYVWSDLVAVAPQVTGSIVAVQVTDNQTVRAGDPLLLIDPVPFQLAIADRAAAIDAARALAAGDVDTAAAATDRLAAAQAALAFAQATRDRAAALVRSDDVSRQDLDQANDAARRAEDARAGAQAALADIRQVHAMHLASLAQAQAEMAIAQWRLARTRLVAPTDGTINNLTVRVGDTATADQPLIGIVDAHAWRIVANYKQSFIPSLREGGTAWVWLDATPWHVRRARIAGIARAISRDPAPARLLPYVAPTTDWIRLQRRFPVTLLLDDGGAVDPRLLMGANARVLIFP